MFSAATPRFSSSTAENRIITSGPQISGQRFLWIKRGSGNEFCDQPHTTIHELVARSTVRYTSRWGVHASSRILCGKVCLLESVHHR